MRGRAAFATTLLFAGLVLLFFWRAATFQEAFFLGDVAHTFYPRFLFTAAAIREGRLPLWNPYLALGQPHLGDPAATALYPPAVLAFVTLPGPAAYTVVVLGNLLLAGVGTVLLARARSLSTSAALLAGIVYAFGGWTLTHVEHVNVLAGASGLPLLFWLVERALAGATRTVLVFGSVLVTVYLLGAHTQMALYAAAAVALYATLRVIERVRAGDGREPLARAATLLLAAGLLGTGLAAIQLLPMAEAIRHSNRGGGLGEEMGLAYSYPPEQILTLVVPYAFEGRLDATAPWGRSIFREMTLYTGLVPLALAVFGAVRARGDGRAAVFLILVAVSVLMALGSYGPLAPVLAALPLFNLLRFPTRILFMGALGIALLSGIGLDGLRARPEWAASRWLLGLGAAALALLVALNLVFLRPAFCIAVTKDVLVRIHPNDQDGPEWYVSTARFLFGLDDAPGRGLFLPILLATGLVAARRSGRLSGRAAVACVLVLSTAELLHFRANLGRIATTTPEFFTEPSETVRLVRADEPLSRAYYFGSSSGEDYYRRITRTMRLGRVANYKALLTEGLRGSFGSVHRVATLEGTGLTTPRQFDLLRALGGYQPYDLAGRDRERTNLHVGMLSLLNGRYVTTIGKLEDPRLRLLRQGPVVGLYRNENALPRAYVAAAFEVVPDPEETVARLTAPDTDPTTAVLLDRDPGFLPLPGSSGQAVVTRYAAEEVAIEATTVGPGILVLSDAFDPDWKAEVDGTPVPILRVDAVLRGVALQGGRHDVRFRYAPAVVARGAVVSGVSAVVLGIGAWLLRRGSGVARPSGEDGEAPGAQHPG
jgi:hypothetical protein